jgi:transcriptional regulator with AAA-type ATPase domain
MSEETISDEFVRDGPRRAASSRVALYVAFQCRDPSAPPSRHVLDGVDVVSFGRGDRATVRREIDGRAGLAVAIPDPVMSSDHGKLVRSNGGWRFDDPSSKNGAVIDGKPTRMAMVDLGAVIQLGHTIFLFDRATLPDGEPADVVANPPPPPAHELATLDPRLAAGVADLARVAPSDVPILLLGETGSGKEVVARAIHAMSRRKGELVAVNCGAIPTTLIESELFGHKKGAFSGALTDRLGHVRSADRGTLLLDEIGELPMSAQTALLRVLQQREVVPVGDSLPVPVDIRFIAATHRNLPAMVSDEKFREDLYSRLLGVTVTLPPLRHRRHDLGILIGTLLRRLDPSGEVRISPAAAHAMFRYDWPRNVREVERALAGGIARTPDGTIDVDHLPTELVDFDRVESSGPVTAPPALDPDDAALRDELVAALARHGGNVTAAAKELGKHREQLHRWARRLGIDLDSFRR